MPVAADVPLDDKQWRKARFPFFPLPDAVTTNVKINIWEDKIRGFATDQKVSGPLK